MAGAFTKVVILFVPCTKSFLVRLAFAGSYVGSIVWVLMIVLKIQKGYELNETW